MSLTYRTIANALTRTARNQASNGLPGQEQGSHHLGFGGQITCSPWEGMYLDQGQAWPAENKAASSLTDDLDRFLAEILSGK